MKCNDCGVFSDRLWEYVRRALSENNRKAFDGQSNSLYRVEIKLAEVGDNGWGDRGGFVCEIRIPRQTDNELGMSIRESTGSRAEAAKLFRKIVDELETIK